MKFYVYVYVYRDPSRGNEPIYCGKGQADRAHSHLGGKSHSNYLNNRLAKMKRNGIEPIINVVNMPSEALAMQCEVDTIARFGRKDLGLGPLLNMTDGGEGTSGYVPSTECRKKQSAAMKGENHPMFGKSHSSETLQKMSEKQKGENNPMYGKTSSRKGKTLSFETRQKQSAAMKGKTPSAETRKKWSVARKGENNSMYGKTHSPESKQKNSDAHKGKVHPKIICPHCGIAGGGGSMKRWHFDKCKFKPE